MQLTDSNDGQIALAMGEFLAMMKTKYPHMDLSRNDQGRFRQVAPAHMFEGFLLARGLK